MNDNPRLRTEYRRSKDVLRIVHIWLVEEELGAIHLNITDLGKDYGGTQYCGGVEIHYRSPPDYMKGDCPSHHNCRFVGGACWHDGTSIWATDYWIPRWLRDPHDHDGIIEELAVHLRQTLREKL